MDIRELAEQKARAWQKVQELGQCNVAGLDPEKRIALDAEYQLAMDVWSKAEQEYRGALQGLNSSALAALAGRKE